MNKWLEKLVHSNVYLAIATALTIFPTSLILNIQLKLTSFLILFLTTFSLYTFNRYAELKEDEITYPSRTSFFKEKSGYIFSLLVTTYLLALFFSYIWGGLMTVGLILLFTLIMGLYSIESQLRLKKITFVKNISVSIPWGLFLVFLPMVMAKTTFGINSLILFIVLSILTFINTIIFDIRDVEGDRANNIMTIPVRYGKGKTRKALFLLNTFLVIFTLASIIYNLVPSLAFILLTTTLYMYIVLWITDKKPMEIVADVFGDGWLLVYGLVGLIVWLVL